MHYLTYLLWFAAAFLSGVQDTIKFRFQISIFDSDWLRLNHQGVYKWIRSHSRDRYSDFDNGAKKKLFWFIPIPDQLADLWHTSKWFKWVSMFGSVLTFSLFNVVPSGFLNIIGLALAFSAIMWAGFMVPFNILLIKGPYRTSLFDWWFQFLK